jgi:hypothetical protein
MVKGRIINKHPKKLTRRNVNEKRTQHAESFFLDFNSQSPKIPDPAPPLSLII